MTELRCSDADRERTIGSLRRHHEDGRITTDELEERIAAAWSAKLVSELSALVADLPPDRSPAADVSVVALPRAPGRRPFAARWRTEGAPDRVMGVPDGGGTVLYVQGTAPLQVRRAFAELEA